MSQVSSSATSSMNETNAGRERTLDAEAEVNFCIGLCIIYVIVVRNPHRKTYYAYIGTATCIHNHNIHMKNATLVTASSMVIMRP